MFVLMMQGSPLTAKLPEDPGLGERFWYWCGASGERYIHSIYRRELCPPVPGAVFVQVRSRGSSRYAANVGRLDSQGALSGLDSAALPGEEEEIHLHLLARGDAGAECVLRDLMRAMNAPSRPALDVRPYSKPVQLDLLAA